MRKLKKSLRLLMNLFKKNEKYDFVCSLGGNCAAAHNLLHRNKRLFSLPFDWLYIENDTPLLYLCEGFKDNFKNFCKKENLVIFDKNENNATNGGKLKYKDNYKNFFFVNHFSKDINLDNEYEKIYTKLKRRINRLFNLIEKSNKILFLISTAFE